LSVENFQQSSISAAGLGTIIVLFGLLAFASNANEILKQWVVAPGSAAELNIAPNCRPDELEEEDITVLECQLLVSNLQIQLASSPVWFRSYTLILSSLTSMLALGSLIVGFSFVNRKEQGRKLGIFCFALLLIIDTSNFIAATATGPLLRAIYLWPALLWFFIHLSLLLAIWQSTSAKNRLTRDEIS